MATIDEVIKGLEILKAYAKEKPATLVYGSHDCISVGDIGDGEVTVADVVKLDALGWHFDSELDAWARFT